MTTRFCYNAMTGEIFSYEQSGNLTDFPRGVLLAYRDYLTTGLKSRKDAEEWAVEWSVCEKCESIRYGKHGEMCSFCQTPLVNKYKKPELK